MLLINDYSRYTWITFPREKLDGLDRFKKFKAKVKNEINPRIKCLRFDRGGEFTSYEFNMFCKVHGIKKQLFAPQTPQ
jgi:hypothetical protein